MKRMEIIYENCDMFDHALWICDLAAFHDIQNDGTRGGFLGRRKRIEKRRKEFEAETNDASE